MRKALGILGMAVATLGLAAGAASSAAAQSGDDREHTIRVDATIDRGRHGRSRRRRAVAR